MGGAVGGAGDRPDGALHAATGGARLRGTTCRTPGPAEGTQLQLLDESEQAVIAKSKRPSTLDAYRTIYH